MKTKPSSSEETVQAVVREGPTYLFCQALPCLISV